MEANQILINVHIRHYFKEIAILIQIVYTYNVETELIIIFYYLQLILLESNIA